MRRLFGSLIAWDALVPLIFLSGLLADGASSTPNLALGAGPFALTIGLAAALCIRSQTPRLFTVLAIHFCALFTGFGFLFAFLVPPLLVLQIPRAERKSVQALAAAAALAALAIFLREYRFGVDSECSGIAVPLLRRAAFAALVLARPFGVSGATSWRAPFVAAAGLAAGLAAAVAGLRTLRSAGADPVARSALVCLGMALLFSAGTASGRACLGVPAAAAPRYAPYALQALFGIFLLLREKRWTPALLALLFACLAKEALVELRPVAETLQIADGKRRWRECFRRRLDVAACDRETNFRVHPEPARSRVVEKLLYLRERRLSLFR